jgi:hypothetical protein
MEQKTKSLCRGDIMESQSQVAYWLDYSKTFGPILIGLLGIFVGYRSNTKLLKTRQIEEERKEIYSKLNDFYGPIQQLLKKNSMLYELFKKSKKDGFKTLPYLLEGYELSENDKSLLAQIVDVNKRIETIILEKSGLVDDSGLRELLGKAATHFSVIRLAYEGQLKSEPDRFANYIYPRDLEEKLNVQVDILKKRLEKLNKFS